MTTSFQNLTLYPAALSPQHHNITMTLPLHPGRQANLGRRHSSRLMGRLPVRTQEEDSATLNYRISKRNHSLPWFWGALEVKERLRDR